MAARRMRLRRWIPILVLACALLVPAAHAGGGPRWLALINTYRQAAGLAPVSANPAWVRGIKDHLTYLEKTPKKFFEGPYVSLHTENPASPFYTHAGALEASSSDLAQGEATSGVKAIDIWLSAPFHAIGMLRPGLTKVALAWDPRTGYAGLDVIRGLSEIGVPGAPPGNGTPILYPGPGLTTNLTTFGGELPDPTQTCGWTGLSVGLPLIVMLAHAPSARLSASISNGGRRESTANGELCVVDIHTYHSSDSVYGPTGRNILETDDAAILIPRHPLVDGTVAARFTQPGSAPVSWRFSVVAPKPA